MLHVWWLVDMCNHCGATLMCSLTTTAGALREPHSGAAQTGHWGYWYDLLEPALVIGNDTVIDVEIPTFVAGQACKYLLFASSQAVKRPKGTVQGMLASLLASMRILLL